MAEWSMEELQDWDDKICKLGEELGLDWYPISYEICDYKEMIGHMAYTGMPTHYRHWSYGKSFERIHRSNLVGMGILPLQVNRPDELASLTLKGNETIFIVLNETLKPLLEFEIIIVTDHGSEHAISVTTQISNYRELEYFNAGGILRYITQKNGH